jgi:hypothetical protein
MPVIAATRSVLRALRSCSPRTPALRRTIDTASANPVAATTAMPDASRTGTASTRNPMATAPAAISR